MKMNRLKLAVANYIRTISYVSTLKVKCETDDTLLLFYYYYYYCKIHSTIYSTRVLHDYLKFIIHIGLLENIIITFQ